MGEKIKLSEIEIKSFRGIKDYKLETNNNSLVFCGANGTGKSSFVNAFEFLFTGKVASLSGIQGLNHNKAIIHRGDKKKDVYVNFKINKHNITRTLKAGLECDEQLEDIVKDFENGSFLLNRQKLLNFINSKPKNRWEEAADLINFNRYDEIEKTFEDCFKSLKSQKETINSQFENNTSEIEEFSQINEVYPKINEILKNNRIPEIDENTDLDEFLKENSIENNALTNIKNISISNINNKYQTQLNVFEKVALSELKSVNTLLRILENSKDYITAQTDTCPVCQHPINSQDVLNYIDSKQNELGSDNSKLKNWQKENSRLLTQIRDLNNKLINFNLDELIINLEKLSNLEISPSEMDRDALVNLENELNSLKNNSQELNDIFNIILLLNERKKIEKNLEEIKMQVNVAEYASNLFSEKKKEAIIEIFKNIEEKAGEYYDFIHEDDDLKSPKFKVKNSKGLILGLIVEGDDEDPRSYASEGHLDSLGLCIFLAFATLYNRHNLLVLDDIISTVDLEHKEMVIRLLFEKFSDYTLIITTHNKLWYEQLQRLADSNNIRHKFTFMEILDWDKIEGPIMSKNPTSKKRIEEHLSKNDTFAAGNAIRRHLEFVLGDLCRMYNIPIPIKKHYTVNDYFHPVKNYFLEEIFKDTNVEEYFKSKFKQLEDTTYIGNLLSHDNDKNYYLTKGEIEKFKLAVYDLENSFKCKTHKKQYLEIDKKRRIGICRNEKCTDFFEYEKVN